MIMKMVYIMPVVIIANGSLSPSPSSQTDTLSKVMTAFAAVLEVPVSQLQFTFDGDPVSPDKTPNDLDMDNDDIIDARLLS